MRLIQASAWYPPDSSGGVEVYLDGLAQDLTALGFACKVTASRPNERPEYYQHNGIEVFRYAEFEQFAQWLKANRGDVYHQHTVRDRCGLPHLRLAKQLGLKTVVTIHMPETVCLRGTMMLHGHQACDGRMDITRCGRCLGVSKQVPPWMLELLSQVPLPIAKASRDRLRQSSNIKFRQLGTTLGIPPQLRSHKRQFEELIRLSDRIVVVCQWLYDAFIANGVPSQKLLLSRHGVSPAPRFPISPPPRPLTIGFMGRWQETKGVQILVEALQRIPDAAVELIIHATHADQHGTANRDRVLALAAQDSRIHIKPPLERDQVVKAIASFDLLAVPSQWLETGPLVVLEAHAVGTPVIGSKLGGIAELVQHGKDGWLLPASDIGAWAQAIQQLSDQPDLVKQLKQGIQPVKTTREVAQEMAQLYESLRE